MDLENLGNDIKYLSSNLKVDLFKKDEILKELNSLLFNSVENNINKDFKFGIAFSGGVDSSLIAFISKKLNMNFKLYTVSVGEKEDLIWSKKVANHLKIPITPKNISFDEAFDVVSKVCNILKEDHPVKVGIGCTLYSVFNLMKNDNLDYAVTGLGSDSLFCGFEKYRIALNKGDMMPEFLNSLNKIYENDIKRDLNIANYFKLKLICPYLDKELIKYAIRIDPKLKINNEEKKIILREAAFNIGLKKEFAYRKKLAAQYGSGFDKAIEVFAKENGFKYKREFLHSLIK